MTSQTVDQFLDKAIKQHLERPVRKPKHYLYVEVSEKGLLKLLSDIKTAQG